MFDELYISADEAKKAARNGYKVKPKQWKSGFVYFSKMSNIFMNGPYEFDDFNLFKEWIKLDKYLGI